MQLPKSILVVDDDPHVLRLLNDLLSSEGYRVTTAADGDEAIRFLTETTGIDLIILDVMMPGADGFGVMKWIRGSTYRDCPVVFLTARTQDADLLRGYGSGGDYYITKPFRVKTLLSAVRYFLGEEKSGVPSA